jgi:hypothetical protein
MEDREGWMCDWHGVCAHNIWHLDFDRRREADIGWFAVAGEIRAHRQGLGDGEGRIIGSIF